MIVALALLMMSCVKSSNTATQSLNDGWNLKTDTLDIDLQVNVPSVVQTDLFEAGLIPHPYLGKVEQDLQWIPQRSWDYSLNFNVDDKIFEKDNIDIVLTVSTLTPTCGSTVRKFCIPITCSCSILKM